MHEVTFGLVVVCVRLTCFLGRSLCFTLNFWNKTTWLFVNILFIGPCTIVIVKE